MILTEDDIKDAWSRIALTTEGRMVRYWLAMRLMEVAPGGMKSGALREFIGTQRLARELVNLLDAPNGNPGRPTDDPGVTLARPSPAEPGARGSRRRVTGSGPDGSDGTSSGPGTRSSSRG